MSRLIHLYCRVLDALAAAGLALMVALVFGNVVLRYAFDSGIAVSEELSRWLFIWITFLGAIVALREGGHLGTDLLLARLPPRLRRVCLVLAQLLMLGICWLLLQGTLEQTRINWSNTAPSSGFSLAFFYGSGVVFAASAGLIVLQQLAAALLGTAPQAAPQAPTATETA